MFYKKPGLPDEGDIVVVTVKKILYHSIFAELDEYDKLEGMIHISEIAPGRIRNIRDYVKEGKKIVCLVLKVNKEKNQIDLSLRRVPMSLRNKKKEEFKQEIKSEKLLEYIGKELKTDLEGMYNKIGLKLIDHFGLLGLAFNEISLHGSEALEELKFPPKYSEVLVRIVQDKIKPQEVSVTCTIILQSLEEDGVEDIKQSLMSGESLAKKKNYKINSVYLSAPKYKLEIFSNEYKSAELALDEVSEAILEEAKKRKVHCELIRKK